MDDFPVFLGIGLLVIVLGLFASVFPFSSPTPQSVANVTGSQRIGLSDIDSQLTFDMRINASYSNDIQIFEPADIYINNGILFGETSLKYNINTPDLEEIVIKFNVTKFNNYGALVTKINGNITDRSFFVLGEHEVRIPKDQLRSTNTIEISAESSSWRMWAPSVYELKGIKIIARAAAFKENVLKFSILEPIYRKLVDGRIDLALTRNTGTMIAELNGEVIYSDAVRDAQSIKFNKTSLFLGENNLFIKADPHSAFEGNARVLVFYKTETEEKLLVPLNLTDDMYNRLNNVIVNFDITGIDKQGGLSVKIQRDNQTKSQYATAAVKRFSFTFDKADVAPGINNIIIQSQDGAIFQVKNVDVRV